MTCGEWLSVEKNTPIIDLQLFFNMQVGVSVFFWGGVPAMDKIAILENINVFVQPFLSSNKIRMMTMNLGAEVWMIQEIRIRGSKH